MHVLVKGATARYYSVTDLIRDNPQTSFPAQPSAETLAEYGVYECADTAPPVPSVGQDVIGAKPKKVGGKWTRAWALVDVSPAELATRSRAHIPTVVTMAQARLALLEADLLGAVEEQIGDMPQAVRIEWQYRATVTRDSPLVAALAALLTLTEPQIDALFVAGAQL